MKKKRKPKLVVTKKIARSFTGQKLKFLGEFITNETLNKKTLELRRFAMRNTNNLFETDWIEQFKLWNRPFNSFCHEIEVLLTKQKVFRKNGKLHS